MKADVQGLEDDPTEVRGVVVDVPAERGDEAAYVVVQTGRAVGRVHRLGGGAVLLGRVPTADVVLMDEGVSREHARIEHDGGRSWLIDLGSTNGTWLEGERVGRVALPLRDGDRIRLGPTTLLKYGFQDTVEQRFLNQLYVAATRDGLTGAFNRQYFAEQIEVEVLWHRRHREPLSLLMVDIDWFKSVNTRFGHPAGDVVLRDVAQTLQNGVRGEDVVARVGGEEFAIVLRRTVRPEAVNLAERLRRSVQELQVTWSGEAISVTLSGGVATHAGGETIDAGTLIAQADSALRSAKEQGRNRILADGS